MPRPVESLPEDYQYWPKACRKRVKKKRGAPHATGTIRSSLPRECTDNKSHAPARHRLVPDCGSPTVYRKGHCPPVCDYCVVPLRTQSLPRLSRARAPSTARPSPRQHVTPIFLPGTDHNHSRFNGLEGVWTTFFISIKHKYTEELRNKRIRVVKGGGRCSLLWPCLVRKNFQNSPSHRILRHMHGALNIDENKS